MNKTQICTHLLDFAHSLLELSVLICFNWLSLIRSEPSLIFMMYQLLEPAVLSLVPIPSIWHYWVNVVADLMNNKQMLCFPTAAKVIRCPAPFQISHDWHIKWYLYSSTLIPTPSKRGSVDASARVFWGPILHWLTSLNLHDSLHYDLCYKWLRLNITKFHLCSWHYDYY